MRKLFCILIVLSMVIPFAFSAHAIDYSATADLKTFTDKEYGFTYTEYTNENNQTIRLYNKQNSIARVTTSSKDGENSTGLSMSLEATRSLLSSLGMEAGFIRKLSDEELREYADCEEIMAVSSYTKTDATGKVVNVTKEEAEDAANSRAIVPAPGQGGTYPSYDTTYQDSYMYISYVVSYRGNGQYKFSVDSVWLTMPYFRGFDSLGACAQNMTVENNTRGGWRSYTMIENLNGVETVYNIDEDFVNGTNSVSYQNAVNGNWYGSAVMFVLPEDYTPYYSNLTYFDYRVHYEYIGMVIYPNLQMNFNTTASYCHTTIGLNINPSIIIDSTGYSASISIDVFMDKHIRTAEFGESITYTP